MMQSNELAPEPRRTCGTRLREARVHSGLSREDVSTRLRVPVKVVGALEADDWSPLGAPVFVRGQLRSYARLLDIDIEPELLHSDVQVVSTPDLVSHSHTPRYQRVLEHATRRAIYIVLTAAIALPVWIGMKPHLSNDLTVATLDLPAAPAPSGGATPASPPQRTPLIASMAALAPPAKEPGVSLRFNEDSWLEVFSVDGRTIEQGLVPAGARRMYDTSEIGRVVLGNSGAVELRRSGKRVDLAPYSRANVARFTLSSDGSLSPVVD